MDTVKLVDLLREEQRISRAQYEARVRADVCADVPPRFIEENVDVALLAECVMNGIRFMLSSDEGECGLRQIDLALLALNDTTSCILGQSFGWGEGLETLRSYLDRTDQWDAVDMDDTYVWRHGFDVPDSTMHSDHGYKWTYRDLSFAWEEALVNLDRLEGLPC